MRVMLSMRRFAFLLMLLSLLAIHGQAQDILSVPQTSLIAFTSDLDGQTDIYTLDSEGNHRRRLTNTPESESDLVWSPDGKYLAFLRVNDDPTSTDDPYTLFVMEADGSHVRALTSVGYHANVRWVPDSQRLMFDLPTSDTGYGVPTAVVYIDQPDVIRFLGDDFDHGHMASPDLTHIAYIHQGRSIYDTSDLYVMQADGTHKIRVMTDVWEAVWLPNSQELAYIHYIPNPNNQAYLSVINRDGTHLRRYPVPYPAYFKWSPDRTQILFNKGRTGLFVMNTDGSDLHSITAAMSGIAYEYDWSPDGTQVVVAFQDVGQDPHSLPRTSRLYVVSADGGYQRLITHEEVFNLYPGDPTGYGNHNPVWQPVPH